LSWTVETLYALRDDPLAFEKERERIIHEYLVSLPPERRKAAYAMQCEFDLARETLSSDELLKWTARKATELAENLSDQLVYVKHQIDGKPSAPQSQP